MAPPQPVGVLGAGSWGTALAALIARNGHPVTLWSREPAHADDLAMHRTNRRYLPQLRLPESLAVTSDLAG